MWNFFLKNTRFSFIFIFVLVGLGIYSILAIPKESAPEVQIPVGIITTILPGAPASDVETLVTNEIERGLNGSLENVKKITSTSREGVSSITVEFEASADIDSSITDLKDAVDTIIPNLPTDAEDPRVIEVDFVDQPILTFSVSGDRSDAEFVVLADQLEKEIESIGGVSRVEITGVRQEEVSVLVEQTSLLRYGLTISDVVNAIRTANATFPVGQIVTDDISYNVVFEGDIPSADLVSEVPITSLGGQPVYVRDVATVRVGLTDATTLSRLSVNGEPSQESISFDVYKQRGGDITRLTADVNDTLVTLQGQNSLLEGLTLYTILDAGKDIRDDLVQLSTSGIQTVLLVILVLVLAIGWREGLIAGLSIPLSFMIGFIGLYFSGNTINFISLFALILGIGVLVDTAIVVVEAINKNMKDNPDIDKSEAARLAVEEFSAPLTAGTLTTVSMFVGLFIVSGVTGQFISGIPFTLIFILFASLLVALGFLPLISSVYLRRRSSTKMERKQLEYSHALEDWYRNKLIWVLDARRRKVIFMTLLIVGFIGSLALVPAGLVKVIFFEQSDVPGIFVEVELPESSIKESTDIAMRRVEEIFYRNDNVIEAFSATVGSGSAFGTGGQNEKFGNFYVALRPDRELTSTEVSDLLRSEFAEIRDFKVTINQPTNGPPTGSPIGVRVLGDDLTELNQYAIEIARLLGTIEGTTNITTSTNNNSTEIVINLDKAKTAAVGLNPQVISQTLRSAVFGSAATSLTTVTDDIDVVVRLNLTNDPEVDPAEANRTTLATLENIEFSTPSGETVLLSSLVNSTLRESSTAINHEDQARIVSVSADITTTGVVRDINAALKEKIATELNIPSDVTIEFGGENEDSNQAFGELFLALVVGVLLMICVLVLQFDSYRHTAYVLSILPFSLIGILVGLAVTGSALSFPSIMGFIALSGIVVNNSILLIDQMNSERRRNPDMPLKRVVVESSVSRLRPILLTSLTTVIGMIPLLYTDDLWIPLATAIIFGLTFSVVITLVLIPIIYLKYPGTVRQK
jgi:HAE1 family hydrophobic/amphiphilic exporter-1